ncbi:MAG: hypothetical protein HQL75_02850 [Magnetococcales bacterium]|nr:hypothetical protein [Magnetococcales bacterium]
MNGYIVFSDLKGFSKLNEFQLRLYYQKFLPALSAKVEPWLEKAKVFNTWGDGLVAIFEDGVSTVNYLINYQEFMLMFDFVGHGIPRLVPRIGAHFGDLDYYDDPLIHRTNAVGLHIHTAARIEPITRPGEIFVTEPFKDAIEQLPVAPGGIGFDSLGQFPLAKGFGRMDLYRLRKANEKSLDIDRILTQNIANDLPEPEKMSLDEEHYLARFKKAPNVATFAEWVDQQRQGIAQNFSGEYLLEVGQLCLNFGCYATALELIDKLESWQLPASGALLYPYRTDARLLKLKANCLTRVGRYNDAANIVYGLWQRYPGDSDILSMLAGQYKRHALFGDGHATDGSETIDPGKINGELLTRARDLYIEAFRRDMGSYYAAINVAYLYRILRGFQEGRGIKLAQHIIGTWEKQKGENWWVACTLAEAEVIQNDYEKASERLRYAVMTHHPTVFELDATRTQLRIYGQLIGAVREIETVIESSCKV